jgi:WD40 repeat protein
MIKVFLGSTCKDLHEHRAAVREAINRRHDCKVVAMEEFGALAGTPRENCLAILRDCDVYVGLLAHCCGFVPKGEELSLTRIEYETARELGMPRLLFVADEHYTPPIFLRESDALFQKQQAFRERVLADETTAFFDNDRQALAARVGEALSNNLPKLRKGPARRPPLPWPAPEPGFVERPRELAALKSALLDPARRGTVGITTALKGAGGFGKTALARRLCADPDVQAAFPDGMLWFELGENPGELTGRLAYLVEKLTGDRQGFASEHDATDALRTGLDARRLLLVIDDVWSAAALRPFLEGGPECARLVTTRDGSTLPASAVPVAVDAMQESEAVQLLAQDLPPGDPERLAALAARLGEWPLLLTLANGVLRDVVRLGGTLADALAHVEAALGEADLFAFDPTDEAERRRAAGGTLELSLARLDEPSRARFLELAVFPEDVDVPLATVELLWHHTAGLGRARTLDLCRRLSAFSLLLALDLEKKTLRLHDVVRAFLRRKVGPDGLAALDAALVQAYRAHCPDGWASGPDDGYFLQWLPSHLRHVDEAEWHWLLIDFRWMAAKLRAAGISALLADHAALPDPPPVSVGATLRLAAHVLARDPSQLAAQLLGRLGSSPELMHRSLCEEARRHAATPTLLPRRVTLTQPGGPLLQILEGHASGVTAVAVTPDGRRCISGSDGGSLRVWNLDSGGCLATLEGHRGSVRAVAVTPDGRRCVSGSSDKTLRVWELASSTCLAILEGHGDQVMAVAMTPDGHCISGSWDRTLRVWDLATGTCLATLESYCRVNAVAVTPDGRRCVVDSVDNTMRVWSLDSGTCLATFKGHRGPVKAVAVTPDGRLCASGSDDKSLRLWDLTSGRCLATLEGHRGPVNAVAMAPDGRHCVSGSADNTLRVWNLASHTCLAALEGQSEEVTAVAITPDGRRCVSGTWDRILRVWDLASGFWLPSREGHASRVTAVAIMADGRRCVSGSYDRTLRLWDLVSGTSLVALESDHGLVMALALTPDGRHCVSGSEDEHEPRIWDLGSDTHLTALKGHEGWIHALAVTPDGRRCVSGADDRTLRLWDLTSGQCLAILEGHRSGVMALALTPDGQHCVSGSADSTLRVWDLATGTCLATLEGHRSLVMAVAVTPDGRRCTSGSDDQTLRIWDLATGQSLAILKGHDGWVRAVAVTPDGRRCVSGSADRTLKVWDLATGTTIATFSVDHAILCCACASDTLFVAGDRGGNLHILDLVESVPTACRQADGT